MKKSGFSLIELSIALIIIGILVASATVASTLINRAKLRAVINDYNTYKNAYNIFYATYEILPGDMSDNTLNKFFGVTNPTTDITQCNNEFKPEDNRIVGAIEGPRAFYQMNLAKIIAGSYDGKMDSTTITDEKPGINVGRSNYMDNAGFNFATSHINLGGICDGWGFHKNNIYGITASTTLLLFGTITADNALVPLSVLTPENALDIDNKIDDGVPSSGKVLADHGKEIDFDQESQRCTTHTNNSWMNYSNQTLSYKKENNLVSCRMMFKMDF
jgi:prepilin-type N-terminal cleavage/methylation domain-containing protein